MINIIHKVKVSGRVQGVGFRRLVQKQAELFGIGGWVKNNSDGTVTIEAQGPEETVKRFFDEVGKGSFLARVDEFEILENQKIQKDLLSEFNIKF